MSNKLNTFNMTQLLANSNLKVIGMANVRCRLIEGLDRVLVLVFSMRVCIFNIYF